MRPFRFATRLRNFRDSVVRLPRTMISSANKQHLINDITRLLKLRQEHGHNILYSTGGPVQIHRIQSRKSNGEKIEVPVMLEGAGTYGPAGFSERSVNKNNAKNGELKRMGIRTLHTVPLEIRMDGQTSFALLVADPLMDRKIHKCINVKSLSEYSEIDWSEIRNGNALKAELERKVKLVQQAEDKIEARREERSLQMDRTEFLLQGNRRIPLTGDKLTSLYIKRSFQVAIDKRGIGTLVVVHPKYIL